jgi:hypothetical protein
MGFPLRSMLGKEYKPSPGKEVRSAETIRSSSEMWLNRTPLSSTMWEKPPYMNMVIAPAKVAISDLYENSFGYSDLEEMTPPSHAD